MNTDTAHIVDQLVGQAMELIEENGNSGFIRQARKAATQQFRHIGFPEAGSEDWKYTNVQPWLKRTAVKEVLVTPPVTRRTCSEQLDTAVRIVTKNGKLDKGSSSAVLPAGLHVSTFTDAVLSDNEQFKAHFGTLTSQVEHFSVANASLFEEGLFVYVEPYMESDIPIHIIHKVTQSVPGFVHPRQLIIAGGKTNVNIVETFEREDGTAYTFINSMSELIVGKQAIVKHYLINTCNADVASVYNLEVQTAEDSQYHNFNFMFSGNPFIRNNIHVVMDGGNTHTKLSGLYISGEDQLVDNHTCVEHKVADCRSDEKYKGILHGSSAAVFNGKIIVHPGAQRTTAYQQNNNLIMDDMATVYTKPELQIFADDVQCTHGVTVGEFDQHALFYLQSRGIPEENCLEILMQAFAFDIIDHISHKSIKKHVAQLFITFLKLLGKHNKTK
ncbi:Fe-S cluster assembly protein SufD [Chitinophaga sp. S165]|uniref:Fe-S cluster assembly protein SufD n=1 Tax=Chitinophaga sp. S165 TaxID=2135462 RepID=UPI000D717EB4|nr:Fe-S cluster assembly protein SufD [Chitinophaga sp. S165]PWV55874.1 iron-regulated ABC transporter permease protein SufD [Chitinophaga sp. S165]